MKMMNEIRAHRSGTVAAVHAAAGETIEANSRSSRSTNERAPSGRSPAPLRGAANARGVLR